MKQFFEDDHSNLAFCLCQKYSKCFQNKLEMILDQILSSFLFQALN